MTRPCSQSACRKRWGSWWGGEGGVAGAVGRGRAGRAEASCCEQEVGELVGPKSKWNRERTAVRHGHDDGEVSGAAGGFRSGARGSEPRTASQRCHCPLTDSLSAMSWKAWCGADAGGRLDPPVPPGAGAGRRAGRGCCRVDVEVGGVADVRAAHPRAAVAADDRPAIDAPAVIMLDGIGPHGRTTSSRWERDRGEKLALGLWDGSTETPPSPPRFRRPGRPRARRRAGAAVVIDDRRFGDRRRSGHAVRATVGTVAKALRGPSSRESRSRVVARSVPARLDVCDRDGATGLLCGRFQQAQSRVAWARAVPRDAATSITRLSLGQA